MKKKMNFTRVLKFLFLFVLLGMWGHQEAYSQSKENDITITAGSSFYSNLIGLDEELPFWLHANRNGVVDQTSANVLGYISGNGTHNLNDNFSFKAGANIYTRYSDHSAFVNTLYAKLTGYNFILAAGKFIDPLAKKEDALSTGSFMYSNNAKPIPKIAFYTDGFVGVPGTNGIVRYSGMFAHGWFEDDRYVRDAYLHEKYFYLNIRYAFFDAIGGIVHNVQWAGTSQGRGKLPSGFKTFREVVFANGSSDSGAPGGEQSNAVGNSVAAYDFSLGLYFNKFDLRAYRLFYLEDKVSTRFRSPWDGIWGLKIEPKEWTLIQNVLWEHINTKRQDAFDFEPRGTASYYNNWIYRTGWTYQGRVIGNPLILTDGGIERPIYNNIIIGHHIGISGQFMKNLDYSLKYTYSRNYGVAADQVIEQRPNSECGRTSVTCAVLRPLSEVKKVNHSMMFELRSTLPANKRFSYAIALTSDIGELYEDRMGIMANIEYKIHP